MTENFIFSLKYRQRQVDLNSRKKSLVFVTTRHLYVQLSYTKNSYLRKNTHLRKDAAFLHFRLKESSENMIFPWNRNIRKHTKKRSFLHFSQIFVRRKFFFFMQWMLFSIFLHCLFHIVFVVFVFVIRLSIFQTVNLHFVCLWNIAL